MNTLATDFLTPRSTTITGMGTILNIGGNYYFYNTSPTEDIADCDAMYSDWAITGEDLRAATQSVKHSPQNDALKR